MTEHLDLLETREPARREAALMAALPAQVMAAQGVAGYAQALAGIDAASICTRTALQALPVLRKTELLERQQALRENSNSRANPRANTHDPFGGFSAIGWRATGSVRAARRVFQSPGPIYEPEGPAPDYWRMARAMFAAGFRAGDLVHNSFSYHMTPAGSMMETGAHALDCTVFGAGVGNTEMQLQALQDLQADAYAGTPSFLRILIEKAIAHGIKLPHMTKALVSGEAFPPSLRDWLAEHGVHAFQAYATADVGLIAYETESREGLVVDEGVIVEIVRPGTNDVLPDGEVGEVVVTALQPDYPLLRFGTGDLSAVLPGFCPSGRTNLRIRGWLGRADQTAKVRGLFVHPSQVAQVLKRHPELGRARLVVEGEMANDSMSLLAECDAPTTQADLADLADAVAQTVRDVTKLRAEVKLVATGSLPNDGKIIDDQRIYT